MSANQNQPRAGGQFAKAPPPKLGEPRKSIRRTAMVIKHQAMWLEAFKAAGTIAGACARTGLGRSTVQKWRALDPAFAGAFDDAGLTITETLETKGLSEAINGNTELLKFFLRARKPEVYRERLEVKSTGVVANVPVAGPPVDFTAITQPMLDSIIREMEQPG